MARNILLHEGVIRKLFVREIVLVKDHAVPVVDDTKINDHALFYLKMNKLNSIEHNTPLYTKDEAMDFLITAYNGSERILYELFSDPTVTDETKARILRTVQIATSCIFSDPMEAHPAYAVSNKDFKELKKQAKERGNR